MKINFLFIFFLSVIFSSCRHYYYLGNVQNVPMLTEKGEFRCSGSFGGWDETNCIELQSAYSVSDNIGIMANFTSAWGAHNSDTESGKGSYFDAAIGYNKPISETLLFEVYGGLGGSGQSHRYEILHYDQSSGRITSQIGGTSNLSFIKLFIQPSFGLKYDLFEVAISSRICGISYPKIEDYSIGSTEINEKLDAIGEKTHYFIEPAFTLRAGWKNVKGQVQICYSGYLNTPKLSFYEVAHLSAGVYFIIPAKTNNQ